MPLLLHIETATPVCSVCISKDKQVLGLKETDVPNSHAALLTVFINDLLAEHALTGNDLDAVVVSMGPGSYTGLRIGVAVAKGLCYAWEKPLLAVNTLQAMTSHFIDTAYAGKNNGENVLFCPMIDARRMEVYCALLDNQLVFSEETHARVIDESSFAGYFEKNNIYFFGDGAGKCKSFFEGNPKAVFTNDFKPSSIGMIGLALRELESKNFRNTAYFEPFYLKDFIATIPKSRI